MTALSALHKFIIQNLASSELQYSTRYYGYIDRLLFRSFEFLVRNITSANFPTDT